MAVSINWGPVVVILRRRVLLFEVGIGALGFLETPIYRNQEIRVHELQPIFLIFVCFQGCTSM